MLEFSDAPYQFFEARPSRPLIFLGRVLNKAVILRSKEHRISDIRIHGAEDAVRKAQAAGDRLVFVINHPSHSDAQVLGEVQRRLGVRSCFMAAYDVFLRSKFCAWSMQKLGNFSIDREGSDRKAMAAAIQVLKDGERGLNVFPEGNVYLSNDRVTPFLDGAAFIALKAQAALKGASVKIIPVSIKLTHLAVPREEITARLQKLAEDSGYIFPKGMKEEPMDAVLGLGHHIIRRLLSDHGFADALRNYDELPLFDLLKNFLEELVSKEEVALGCVASGKDSMPARIGRIRSRIHQLRMSAGGAGDKTLHGLAQRAILALRIHGYLTPYLTEKPSIDRYDETVERIAEDFYSKAMPRTGPRRALVSIREPLAVADYLKEAGGDLRRVIPVLTRKIQRSVQDGVDELNALNKAPGGDWVEVG
ncbi:lysophospholipid acyltransferase family protein [Luteolibacter sp. AS25]|uniref:lysophospholipid acyltransferase family protein n=1 Tax=Luteolibacter sp. AS25 TaxID=3135776 RepID=UPI00398A5FEA